MATLSFRALLGDHGVELSGREGAAFKGGALRFPVSGGKFDPTKKKGTVEHGGTVLFERGGRALSLKKLQLKTSRPSSPIVAKLGGGQLKLGPAARLVVAHPGFTDEVTVSKLRLSSKFATRLSKRLHVAVNPIFPAEHPGPFTLPIFNGKLAPDFSAGFLQLQGAMELLQLGGGQLIWHDPVLDLGGKALSPEVEVKPSPPYAGKAGQLAVAALDLAAGTAAANPGQRTLTVTGAPLTLPDSTASLFNEVFAKPQGKENVFAAGEILGRISFVAEAQ